MDYKEFRTNGLAFGSALFVAGFVVSADLIIAVNTSAPSRHASYNTLALWVAVGVMALGAWIMPASVFKTKWLWLPGKKNLRIREEAARAEEKKRDGARDFLTAFTTRALYYMVHSKRVKKERFGEWLNALIDLVNEVWGVHEGIILLRDLNMGSVRDSFQTALNPVSDLVVRCKDLPLEPKYDPDAAVVPGGWREYIQFPPNRWDETLEPEVKASEPDTSSEPEK